MEFFNKREDVIDLELTPYGEYLLSEGHFKPEFYAFFDDEVLYDSRWAGVEKETQNKIKDRIKEVPRTKTQYLFTNTDLRKLGQTVQKGPLGLPGQFSLDIALNSTEQEQAGIYDYTPEQYIKQYALPWPLGNSSFNSSEAPAWDIKLLYNNIDGHVAYYKNSMHPYLNIPQLDVTIKYQTEALPLNKPIETSKDNYKKSENFRLSEFDELHSNPPIYDDGYYDFQEDFVVLEINEHNVPYLKDNFEIEVFEIWEDPTEKYNEELIQKYFIKKPTVIDEKGLLKSEKEMIKSQNEDLEINLLPLDTTYVNHFFNVYVDHEIEQDLMCQLNPDTKEKGYFISDPLDCAKDNEVNILSSDIYKKAIETTPECD